MSKRPLHNVILTNGGKQYHGSPCDKCGATLRWVANRCCVACLREFNAANVKRWRENKALRNVPAVK
jgi:predicted amidophosphoribosyltransferase